MPDAKQQIHAVVDGAYRQQNGAVVDGIRRYNRVQAALDDAPDHADEPYVIFIKNGTYYEKLYVRKPHITLVGESIDQTLLAFDAAAGAEKPKGGKYGTTGSASTTVSAPHFRALNLTFQNSFDYPANKAKSNNDPTKLHGSQGVALKTASGSHRAYFHRVRFISHQDTLYADAGTQYYKDCYIQGNVDFIFGAGQAVFDHCDIVSLDRGRELDNGFVTAASTSIDQPYGFLFVHCRLLKQRPEMTDQSVALGRPWHPGADPRAIGSVVFKHCYMDSHISAKGWVPMSAPDGEGGKVWFYPEDSRFYEYGSYGPGAMRSECRKVLTASEAERFSIRSVLDGWLPE